MIKHNRNIKKTSTVRSKAQPVKGFQLNNNVVLGKENAINNRKGIKSRTKDMILSTDESKRSTAGSRSFKLKP